MGDRVVDDPLLVAHQGPAASYQHEGRLAVLAEVAGESSPEGDERVLAQAEGSAEHVVLGAGRHDLLGEDALGHEEAGAPEDDLVRAARAVAADVVDRSHRPAGGREVADGAHRGVRVPRARVVPVDQSGVGSVVDHGQRRVVPAPVEVVEAEHRQPGRGRESRLAHARGSGEHDDAGHDRTGEHRDIVPGPGRNDAGGRRRTGVGEVEEVGFGLVSTHRPSRAVVIWLISAAVALTGTLAATTTAASAHQVHVAHTLFGMHDGSSSKTSPATSWSYAHLHEGAVRLWDVGVQWREVELTPGHYTWTKLDQLVEPGAGGPRRGHDGRRDDAVVLRLRPAAATAQPRPLPELRVRPDASLQALPRHAGDRRLPGLERGQRLDVLDREHAPPGAAEQDDARRAQPRGPQGEGDRTSDGHPAALSAGLVAAVLPDEPERHEGVALLRRAGPEPLPAAEVRPTPRRSRGQHRAAQPGQGQAAPRRRPGLEADLEHRGQLRPPERQQGRHQGSEDLQRPAGGEHRADLPPQRCERRQAGVLVPLRPRADRGRGNDRQHRAVTAPERGQGHACGPRLREGAAMDARQAGGPAGEATLPAGPTGHLHVRGQRRVGHPADLLEPLPPGDRHARTGSTPRARAVRWRLEGQGRLAADRRLPTGDGRPVGPRRSSRSRPQTPIGCQTVLVSRNAVIPSRPGSSIQSGSAAGARRTRLRFSAAATSRAVACSASPARPAGRSR